MKVFVRGRGEIQLTQSHFVAAGGQASVYVRDGVAFKIYTDPASCIPEAKFRALAAIADRNVVKPDALVLSRERTPRPLGYTMRALTETIGLSQLFTRAFRERNGVGPDRVAALVANLRARVMAVHAAQVVVVDLNEFNVLVAKQIDESFLIDVDSFQTAGFPATVILPAVRDYSVRASQFSELSDWFSFAVLSFQAFVGVHPYRGTHQASTSVPKAQRLEHRMRERISAFRRDVSLPRCCYPLDDIPSAFRAWLESVLERGERTPAPEPTALPGAAPRPATAVVASTGDLVIEQVQDLDGWRLVDYAEADGHWLAWVTDGTSYRVLLDGHPIQHGDGTGVGVRVGFTDKLSRPVAVRPADGAIDVLDLGRHRLQVLPLACSEIAKSGPRFYGRCGTSVVEIETYDSQAQTLATPRVVANVLELATRLFDGCAIQSLLGSVYGSLFTGPHESHQVRLKELDTMRIVDARFTGTVLMVLAATRAGRYDRLVYRFDRQFVPVAPRRVEDVHPTGLNFVELANGVCVCITEDEKLEVFGAGGAVRVVENEAISGSMRLMLVNASVGFERDGRIYTMRLR